MKPELQKRLAIGGPIAVVITVIIAIYVANYYEKEEDPLIQASREQEVLEKAYENGTLHEYDEVPDEENNSRMPGTSRPGYGEIETDGRVYYFTSDWKNGIFLETEFNERANQLIFTVHETRFIRYAAEEMVLTGEGEDYWVISDIDSQQLRLHAEVVVRPGYVLYLAKDWSWLMMSPYVDDLYCKQVTEQRFNELEKQCEPTESMCPEAQRVADFAAAAAAYSAATDAYIEAVEGRIAMDEARHEAHRRSFSTTFGADKSKPVEIKKYAPDYTGGKYMYYCDDPKCRTWGPQHWHEYH